MQASAFQQLHSENLALHRRVDQQDAVIQQLQVALQQKHLEVHGEKVSSLINVLASAIPAPSTHRRRWWHRFGKRIAAKEWKLPTHASLTVPQALIDEVANHPYAYHAEMSKDEAAQTQTMTVMRKPAEEIARIEADLKARADAMEQARKDAEAKAAVVGLDGQTPARESTGKILTVAR